MATEVRIKIMAFPYYVEVVDPVTEKTLRGERMAYRDEVVELSDVDLERALRFDAIYLDEYGDPVIEVAERVTEPEDPSFDPLEADADELAEWIQTTSPTIEQILGLVGDDPEKAERFLEAEETATGESPRVTLKDALEKIIEG